MERWRPWNRNEPLCVTPQWSVYSTLVRTAKGRAERLSGRIRTNHPSPDLSPQGERGFQALPLGPIVFEAEAARALVARAVGETVDLRPNPSGLERLR